MRIRNKLFSAFWATLAICLLLNFTACKPKENANDNESPEMTAVVAGGAEKPRVEITELKQTTFYHEILGNAKLKAVRKAELWFKVSEVIEQVNVKNGDRVIAGATLAVLNNFTYSSRLKRAHSIFEKAKVDLQDVLIGQGYNPAEMNKIPPTTLKISKIKSGYENAELDLETAEYEYKNTILKAPFSGVVGNVTVKEHNLPGNAAFCVLIDDSGFEAVFSVLESEMSSIRRGQPVQIMPFSKNAEQFTGSITEINPQIDENGLVVVKAYVKNGGRKLFEGMNVRVKIQKPLPDCLVVPKSAVVLRSGKEVLFTYKDGRAIWNYVKTLEENSTHYVIETELKPGEQVIVTGNLNLGNDAEVEVEKNNAH